VLVALNPITKYPLAVAPVNAQLELILRPMFGTFTRVICCIVSSVGILIVSITVPGFHTIMALLGSFFSFVVSVIFPEVCYMVLFSDKLSKRQKAYEGSVVVFGIVCAVLGTIWSFLPNDM
jgi:amino acid permease